MKILHIYREKPEELVELLVKEQKGYAEVIEIRLYEDPVDYDSLIEAIETTDRVFTW